jgi:hypothetical protein
LDGSAVTVPVVITTTDFVIPGDGHWHLLLNGMDQGPVMGYATTVDLLPGVYAITAALHDPDHNPLGVEDTVTVTVTYDPPPPVPTVTILSPEDGDEFIAVNGAAVTVPVVVTTTDFIIPDDGYWRVWLHGVPLPPVYDYATTIELLPGTYVVTAELLTTDNAVVGSDMITITVSATYQLHLPIIMNGAGETSAAPAVAPAPANNISWLLGLPMLLVGLPFSRRFASMVK